MSEPAFLSMSAATLRRTARVAHVEMNLHGAAGVDRGLEPGSASVAVL
jgi:hypothetical protein